MKYFKIDESPIGDVAVSLVQEDESLICVLRADINGAICTFTTHPEVAGMAFCAYVTWRNLGANNAMTGIFVQGGLLPEVAGR